MRISKSQLKRIIREAQTSTKKYDDDSALKGKQSKLPDALQKSIIDRTVDDREEEEEEDRKEKEEKNETFKIKKSRLQQIIKEEYARLLLENNHSIEQKLMELYKQGIDPRAAAETLAQFYDSPDLEDAAINMVGDMQDYAYDVIDQMDQPTEISDYLYGGDRRRRY